MLAESDTGNYTVQVQWPKILMALFGKEAGLNW